MEKRKIEVYIDGSSVDVNARDKGKEAEWHGAYAGVFYVDGQEVMRMKGYEKGGTIGKMELTALVEAMRKLRKDGYEHIEIFSDSQYVVYGATKWYAGWMKKKFHGIKFPELWREMDILTLGCCFNISWVKGHHECPGNHIADKLANEALGAGITGWKVSGKERFLLFDKVECFETDTIIVNNIVPEGSVWVSNKQLKEIKKAEFEIQKEIERSVWFSDDNDFTDMAKKKPDQKLLNHYKLSAEISEKIRQYPLLPQSLPEIKPEKIYPTWYEQQIAKHKELIKKQTEEFNQMMDRYAKHVEGIIYQLKIEREKQDGTRSTKNQDSAQ